MASIDIFTDNFLLNLLSFNLVKVQYLLFFNMIGFFFLLAVETFFNCSDQE